MNGRVQFRATLGLVGRCSCHPPSPGPGVSSGSAETVHRGGVVSWEGVLHWKGPADGGGWCVVDTRIALPAEPRAGMGQRGDVGALGHLCERRWHSVTP